METILKNDSITFFTGYYRRVAEEKGIDNLVEYQLTPGAPHIYCEKDSILTSEDIVNAKAFQDSYSNDYWMKIQFTDKAFYKLNALIIIGLRHLVLFINGFPFYTLGLSGPFDTPTILMGPKNKKEIELLLSRFNT